MVQDGGTIAPPEQPCLSTTAKGSSTLITSTSMRARRTDDTPVADSPGTDNQESTEGESDENGDEDVEDKESVLPAVDSSSAVVGFMTVAGSTKSSDSAVFGSAADGGTTTASSTATIMTHMVSAVDRKDSATTPDKLLVDNGRVSFLLLKWVYLQYGQILPCIVPHIWRVHLMLLVVFYVVELQAMSFSLLIILLVLKWRVLLASRKLLFVYILQLQTPLFLMSVEWKGLPL